MKSDMPSDEMDHEPSKLQFSKIDELFGTLLERLETRYPIKLERERRIIEIDLTGLKIDAKETEEGMILVECNFADEEGLHSRVGGVTDSADAIESVLTNFTVSSAGEGASKARRRWWRFGK